MNKLIRAVYISIGATALVLTSGLFAPVQADSHTFYYTCSDKGVVHTADGTVRSAPQTVVTCGDGSVPTRQGVTSSTPDASGVTITCSDGPVVANSEASATCYNVAASIKSVVSLSPTSGTGGGAFTGDCGNGGVKVSITPTTGGNNCVGNNTDNNPIYAYLRSIVQWAGGIFGLLMVLMVIISGIQYITSAGNAQGVEAAKKRLANAVLGIILFLLMMAILNYLIPGGVL